MIARKSLDCRLFVNIIYRLLLSFQKRKRHATDLGLHCSIQDIYPAAELIAQQATPYKEPVD